MAFSREEIRRFVIVLLVIAGLLLLASGVSTLILGLTHPFSTFLAVMALPETLIAGAVAVKARL